MRLFSLLLLCALSACTIEKMEPPGPSSDDFQRAELGAAWKPTSDGNYRIVNGELVVDHAHNHPLWLKKPIPRDAVIEFDAWSNDPAGDIKVEAWGDGRSYATSVEYTATSYVFIFGGWHNTISAIARLEEHGADRRQRSDVRVVRGQKYHFRIARKGGHIDWYISEASGASRGGSPEAVPRGLPGYNDGKPFLSYDDPNPLEGPRHSFFGINDWEAEVHFDNLQIH